MLEKIAFKGFTAFEDLEVRLAPGINVFIGENGTGKTHILKAAYAACVFARDGYDPHKFATKVCDVLYPSGKSSQRLVKRLAAKPHERGSVQVSKKVGTESSQVSATFLGKETKAPACAVRALGDWSAHLIDGAYVPAKDMLANAPGFLSLASRREIHFEQIYVDLLHSAYLPPLRKRNGACERLLGRLEERMGGTVTIKGEEFFLSTQHGDLEFTLLAEGLRKLGLLWLLIRNGTLGKGSVLCWDEPETNLNPALMETLVWALVELQRMGMQILLATHDSLILDEFDLQTSGNDSILYHSLYRHKGSGEIQANSTSTFLQLEPNAIQDAFGSVIGRSIERSMGSLGK